MNGSDPPHRTSPAADSARRDAWEELLLCRLLQARSRAEASPEERWRRMSGRVAAHEHLRSMHEAMALRGAEFRQILVLWRPWPALLPLFS